MRTRDELGEKKIKIPQFDKIHICYVCVFFPGEISEQKILKIKIK